MDAPGDFDLDGTLDLVIGSITVDSPPYASAWITSGYGSGEQPLSAATTLASFEVSPAKIDLESSLGCDLNDDGLLDVAFGAVQGYVDPTSRHGVVYVVYSPSGSYLLDTDADAILVGQSGTSSGLGYGLDCGDVDLDGQTELLVGAPFAGPGGAVLVVRGGLSGVLEPEEGSWSLLSEHRGADAGADLVVGDLTGDGVLDVAIGADHLSTYYASVGAVYVVEGPIGSDMSLSDADSLLVGPWYSDYAGSDVDVLADQDGDGVSDLVVASYQHPYAYVVNGPAPAGTSQLEDADAVLADSDVLIHHDQVTGGDFDGDGFTDVVVGFNDYNGEVKDWATGINVVRGPLAGAVMMPASGEVLRTPTYSGLGRSVTTADVDGDGLDDLWAGAVEYSGPGGAYTGAGYLFLGSAL